MRCWPVAQGLTAVIAHMGMPQHAEFLDLAERYANVHLDTTMVFVDFFDGAQVQTDLARSLAPRLAALQDRVVLGTDFPNIPYAYAHQIEALARTGLDDDWMRAVLWHNGARLFDIAADAARTRRSGRIGPPGRARVVESAA